MPLLHLQNKYFLTFYNAGMVWSTVADLTRTNNAKKWFEMLFRLEKSR